MELLVVHAISLPPGQFGGPWIDDLFLGRLDAGQHPFFAEIAGLEVSAHFLIRRDGTLVQYVSTEARAWHAGRSCWQGRERCNDFSVGVELEGCDDQPFEAIQYRQLARLARLLMRHYPIAREAIVGHADIAPGRKTDPGPCFDWPHLRTLVSEQGEYLP